jgi:hypothetical protein
LLLSQRIDTSFWYYMPDGGLVAWRSAADGSPQLEIWAARLIER